LQFFISIFAVSVLPLLWSMFSDIVDHQELTTGRRTSGLIFSSSSMSQSWVALGAALSGWVLAYFKYVPDAVQQNAETIRGEQFMISLLPAICCLLAFLGMYFYPLSDKRVKENYELLEEKRAEMQMK